MGFAHIKFSSKRVFIALCLVASLFVQVGGSLPAMADERIDQANTALLNGKYKDVVSMVGKVVASGKGKPEVMARGLLLRGIAYRNQGKTAQAIADLSNAEWLQKLRGGELKRLYAERALAYDAAGQTALAQKDRRLAGTNSLQNAKNSGVDASGVRVTSVSGKKSGTTEFFGGLGNLFGFNSNKKKPQAQIKTKIVAKADPTLREIPTLDSKEALRNRAVLNGEVDQKLPKKTGIKTEVVSKTKIDSVPSNSAWVARSGKQKVANKNIVVASVPKTVAGEEEVLPWTKSAAKSTNNIKQNGQGPIQLTPKKANPPSGENGVTSFFQNMFGGPEPKKVVPPVNPGDDIISADQVASIEPAKKATNSKVVLKMNSKKAVVNRKVSAAKKVVVANKKPKVKKQPLQADSRALYHVQLGVFGEAQAADKFVSRLNNKFGAVVGSRTAMVVETDLGQKRRQYRVYLGPFRSRAKGLKSCRTLTKLGMRCSLVE